MTVTKKKQGASVLTISTVTNTGPLGRVHIDGDEHELLSLAKTILNAIDKEFASIKACSANLRLLKVGITRRTP